MNRPHSDNEREGGEGHEDGGHDGLEEVRFFAHGGREGGVEA